ncbi:cell division protein FtsQ/DivIB [Agaribacter marinus]|uniref:Cell division protein FtsQ n=1 Tax=Agaribacter marinus TaxID=1431249 RepID=A0AA37WKJ9_9ALTE|nr:cell division protein FtsQ/DivIB [Agaribacter marinus]GLR71060.1 cell division protein FtsQ [Agaribacter marinus]
MSKALIKTEPEVPREKVSVPVGLTVFVIVLCLLIFAGLSANEWLKDEQKLPVQDVVFTGDIKQVDKPALEALIRKENAGSFFAIDVNDVHDLVETQAWVYKASIRKRWPSKLYIHIVEQEAVAVWNSDLLLNKYGDSFAGLPYERTLPVLFGPNGSEKTALVGYNHMRSLLFGTGQNISELVLSERFAWKLRLKNNIVLNLGRQEYIDRLQRFIDIYPLLKEKNKPIDYIDLRYDTGLAVGWLLAQQQTAPEQE